MKKLTKAEQTKLASLVAIIRKGQESFLATATAIFTIGKDNLFAPHKSLADYCEQEFDFSATETSRYENAGAVLSDLSGFDVLPSNEGQARELAKLKSADRRKAVWEAVLKRHNNGDRITAALIAECAGNGKDNEVSGGGKSFRAHVLRMIDICDKIEKIESLDVDEVQREEVSEKIKHIIDVCKRLQAKLKQ